MELAHKSALSPQRKRLLDVFQQINFGRLESITIRNGQPVLDVAVRVVREHKFGGENGPRPESMIDDFAIKKQISELFDYFDRMFNCVIDSLEIKHGLPFRMIVTEPLE